MFKSRVEKIKQAAKIGDLAFEYILKEIKTGISERKLAALINSFIKEKNAKFAFPIIVAFGENSSEIHHKTGNRKLKHGDIIMLDFGAKVDGYCADMTRTIFFGKPTLKQQNIYQIVLKAQQKAIDFINHCLKLNKTIRTTEVDKIARDYIISCRYPNMPHALGHGIGRKVHQSPRLSPKSKEVLKEGMVFSIEPGIYLKNWGGVRIEDLFVINRGKLEQLTLSPV